ncbi:MAG: membrane protein insertase YidC [Deltaproteobacteria bacterium]|nr:MAG: membrane protein insertase YidC [Deltaproteobacteria bacterium]
MNQEKRSLLAALLSFIVLMTWFYFFGNPTKKQNPLPQAQEAAVVKQESEKPALPQEVASISSSDTSVTSMPAVISEKENTVMKMSWTSRGGTLSSLELKNFTGHLKPSKENQSLVNLIPFEGDKALTLLCDHCNQNLPGNDQYRMIQNESDPTVIAFEAQQEGLKITKTYQWNPNQYLFNLKITVENKAAQEFKGRMGLGWEAKQYPKHPKQGILGFLNRQPEEQRNLLYKAENKVLHGVKPGETREVRGIIPWAGIEDRYFLIALVSRQMSADQILKLESTPEAVKMSFFPSELVIAPQGKQESQYTFYLGPKQHSELETAGVGLEGAVDYGWFGLIAVPILKLLQFFHGLVKNWGLAVIVLTLFIKILTNPLTIKSMKQMKAMQALQPQLQALKERYKDDKQRLNTETMALFKKIRLIRWVVVCPWSCRCPST